MLKLCGILVTKLTNYSVHQLHISTEKRFLEASKVHTESVERHLSKQHLNSPETLTSHNSSTADEASEQLMKKITASYLQHGLL